MFDKMGQNVIGELLNSGKPSTLKFNGNVMFEFNLLKISFRALVIPKYQNCPPALFSMSTVRGVFKSVLLSLGKLLKPNDINILSNADNARF